MLEGLVQHAVGIELGDDLFIFYPRVGLLLVPVQQLFPGRRHVFMGADHGDQGANGDIALDYQNAAEQIKQERRRLIENIVERLNHVFALEDLEPNVVDRAQPVGEPA